eukprot:3250487-Rhodomonas_salina.1
MSALHDKCDTASLHTQRAKGVVTSQPELRVVTSQDLGHVPGLRVVTSLCVWSSHRTERGHVTVTSF